ncbi:MAG: ATP-binding protein [Chitinophagaceae bacterium]
MSTDSTMELNASAFLEGGGLSGTLIRSMDWKSHPLGEPAYWPDTLKIILGTILASPFAMAIAWGPSLTHFYNDAFIPLMGWSKHPVSMGNSVQKSYPESWHLLGPLFQRVMQGESMKFEDLPLPSERHGVVEKCWFNFSYSPIRNLEGTVVGILVVTIETTQKLQYEQQLKDSTEVLQVANGELTATVHQLDESERTVRNLIRQAPIAMCLMLGPQHVVSVANSMMLELWSKTTKDVMNKPIFLAVPDLSGQGLEEALRSVYKNGNQFRANEKPIEFIRNGQKEIGYHSFVFEPYTAPDREIIGVIAIIIDLTEHVISRRKLDKTYQQLRMAVGTANLGTWVADLGSGTLTLSERGSEIFDLAPGQKYLFTDMMAMVLPEYHESLKAAGAMAIKTNKPFETEMEIRPAESTEKKWIRATGMVTRDKTGIPAKLSGTLLDITERKLDELRKNDFIGMVSHELKTPLTSISAVIQMAQVKQDQPDNDFIPYALQKAHIQVKRMEKLINGFLNISRLESGKVHLDKTRFNLDDLIREIIDELSLTTRDQEVRLATCSGLEILADREKIGSVINNLLSNAIKYSNSKSPIELTCLSHDSKAIIAVKDQGIGISADDQARIFERYYRVNNDSRKVSGFGIGLYLSSEIILRHNGIIGVESEPGKGSTFYFSLPME